MDTIQHFGKIVNIKKRTVFSALSIFCQIVEPFDERFAVKHEVQKQIIKTFVLRYPFTLMPYIYIFALRLKKESIVFILQMKLRSGFDCTIQKIEKI